MFSIGGGTGGGRIGASVSGGTATRILYVDASGNLAGSANLVFDATNVRFTVGTGSGTSAGAVLGYAGSSGLGKLWGTHAAAGTTNYVLVWDNNSTSINAPSNATAGQVAINIADVAKFTQAGTAGAGPSITMGTATTDVGMSWTQTWNGAVAFNADKGNVTATSFTNGSAVLDRQVNGGSLFRIEYYAANVTAAVGATATATNLIPAKAQLIGIATRITTELGASTGTTGYTVGDGSDADRWGTAAAVTVGTVTDQDSATADPSGYFNSANNVVLTATGGNFDGTGVIRVVAAVLTMQAPTS